MAEGLLQASWPVNQFLFGSSSVLSQNNHQQCKQSSEDSQHNVDQNQSFITISNELLDSIFEFYKNIQNKAFINVKQTTKIMQKFKAIKAFKEYIDWQWSRIQKITKEFLDTDELLVKQYTQVKSQAQRIQEQVQNCQSIKDIEQLQKLLQNSSIFSILNNKLEFSKIENRNLEQKIQKWKNSQKQILRSLQIMKQYAMKIVETVMDEDEDGKQMKINNSCITKMYFTLRDEINQILDYKLSESSKKTLQNTQILQSSLDTFENLCNQSEQYKIEQKNKEERQKLMDRILDLYKDVDL